MSLDVPPHNEPLPSTLIASRDVVSELDAALNSTGPSNAQTAEKTPPTSAPNPTASGDKKRKAFKVTKPVSRSLSTPHIRGVIMSDAEADKKRNKLGYQRTSIACSHCRRRKIRCLVAEGDPLGRCQNCIRLKKDCAFFPVDQQGVLDTKSQPSSSGAASGHSTGSAPSSSTPPDLNPSSSLEGRRDPSAFPGVPSNMPDEFSGLGGLQINQISPFASPTDNVHSSRFDQRVFQQDQPYMQQAVPGLQHQSNSQSPWFGTGGFHDPASGAPQPSLDYPDAQYLRHNTMPIAGEFSAPSYYDPSTQRTNPYAFQPQRSEQISPSHPSHPSHPPQTQLRSMSYGQLDNYPHSMYSFSNQPPEMHPSGIARPMPHPLDVQNASIMGPGPQSAPLRPEFSGYLKHQQPYAMQHGEFAQKHILPSSDPNYSDSFYQDSAGIGSAHESQTSPLDGPSNYAIHPSQPG